MYVHKQNNNSGMGENRRKEMCRVACMLLIIAFLQKVNRDLQMHLYYVLHIENDDKKCHQLID